MAKVYITAFQKQAHQWVGAEAIAAPHAEEAVYVEMVPVAIGVEAKSAVFPNGTRMVRVHADAICSIAFGVTPVASVDTMRLAAGQTEYFGVKPGEKLSVITNT